MSAFSEVLLKLIKERRSVRIFTGEKIPREKILSIIEAGVWAPTGCNNQELRFLIIDDENEINNILRFKPFFKGVSAIVLIFCDMSLPMSRMYIKSKVAKHLFYIDAGLTIANMILYAQSMGIHSCIFNVSEYHFGRYSNNPSVIKKVLNMLLIKFGLYKLVENNFEFYLRRHLKIPEHLKIVCGVAFGYAKEYPDVRKATHGGKKIMRENIDYYIIHKYTSM